MHGHPKIPRIGQMFEHQFLYWVPFLEDPIKYIFSAFGDDSIDTKNTSFYTVIR